MGLLRGAPGTERQDARPSIERHTKYDCERLRTVKVVRLREENPISLGADRMPTDRSHHITSEV